MRNARLEMSRRGFIGGTMTAAVGGLSAGVWEARQLTPSRVGLSVTPAILPAMTVIELSTPPAQFWAAAGMLTIFSRAPVVWA